MRIWVGVHLFPKSYTLEPDTVHTEYDDPYNESRARPLPEKATPFSRLFGTRQGSSLQQKIEQKKRGIGRQRYPFVGVLLVV